ncbi:hypothetical protein NEOC95_001311 [Neochlamydia sp. AcF95]|nr:hypothetical protein [Neochlamydia sp. AcF95]
MEKKTYGSSILNDSNGESCQKRARSSAKRVPV